MASAMHSTMLPPNSWHMPRRLSVGFAILLTVLSTRTQAVEPSDQELDRGLATAVTPFLQTYCQGCHGKEQPKAKLDLTAYGSLASIAAGHQPWELVLERLEAGEMPPEEAKRQPTPKERQAVIEWIRSFRTREAERNAGDPGNVPARRLSNAEYNYTIRDLTGVDIRPAREFPVDPANEAGFDNSSESLVMSPALLKKYVDAARLVADHLVLKPSGFAFAPHPVATDTDRDKYCVKRIVQFYEQQPTDYADYFLAAWRFQHRVVLGQPSATLADIAQTDGLSPKYLATVWSALAENVETVGPMAKLQTMWRGLPSPSGSADREGARRGCYQMRDFVKQLRRKLEPKVSGLKISGVHEGSQSFVLWKNRQYAANRRTYSRDALQIQSGDNPPTDPSLAVPADAAERVRYEASFARFCDLFPDAFYISERGRDYVGKPKEQQEKGRLLSAGFHSMMGYFRDDGPLYDLVLDERQRAELDTLWQELDFVASAPMRQYSGFLWFERTDSRFMRDVEFDFARAEDKDATSNEKITRLAEVYVAKARANGGGDMPIQAIDDYFRNINAAVRWVEQARLAAEPSHLAALVDFAERAYRRELAQGERDDLVAFYRSLRKDGDVTHEEAIQDVLVSVLMSPRFCYRLDLAAAASEPKRSLTDYELASRLSYFLWSSMPDAELLAWAAAGELHRPEVLVAQTQRMLKDDRIRGLATEFGGNWLDFRRFEQHNSVDRGRFPTFTNELRQAMFEEPVRFFVDLAVRNGSVLDFLYARHTFVNRVLAEHYDLTDLDLDADEWVRVADAAGVDRGGLLAMAVFLTQNAPGLRTSPVKRGYWVVRRLLGERIPPPPPNVPELPSDEAKLDLSLRETLARHREHASCAGCHQRFDSFGLVFENYGPTGERRERDLAGRPVDTRATFPGSSEGEGLDGLRDYLRQHRQADFLDNLCRKLLSYALGRSLLPSDDRLLAEMRDKLATGGHRFGILVDCIVTSPQFLTKRGQ
jgi:mono/diheme cytochrome c family protein